MSGQQSNQVTQTEPADSSYEDFREESKKPRFPPRWKVGKSKVKKAPAGYTNAKEGLSDGVLDHDLTTKRKISAETAENYGLDQEVAHRVLCDAASFEEAKHHADADSIVHILTPKQVAAVVEDSTVGRLYRRFHVLLREIVLPRGGFTSKDQADMASQLAGADRDLRKHLTDLGVDWPTQRHERVLKGEAMRSAFRYAKEKLKAIASGHPPRRRGRPARTDQPHV